MPWPEPEKIGQERAGQGAFWRSHRARARLMAEYERLEPAWKHECRMAYAVCLGADDPTMLRMAVR
jgi:hypothetical protein